MSLILKFVVIITMHLLVDFLILIMTKNTNSDMENVNYKSTPKQDTEGALYIAHSENCYGKLQTMKQHSEGVARMMQTFSLSGEYVDMYTYCGLLHDIGKYSKGFQKYIRAEGEKEPHAKWGAYMAKMDKLINVAFPVFGHHAGLPNRDAMFETLNQCGKEENKWLDVLCSLKKDGLCIPPCDNSSFNRIEGNTTKELFVRMLYSSLVDADSLDTERHFDKEQYYARPQLSLDVDALLDTLNYKLSSFSLNSPLNRLRTEVRLYAQSLAAQPQGCFSMTLPTGMGKTLCSLNWALHHAKVHSNIKRIVIVLPFLSIIDQTAKELKSIFKDHDVILEHHSNVIYEGKESKEEEFYCKDPKQLATENWDYPIVVTTTVQFFESLFSNQRSKCRKLHNLQDSIVIFDEIQTLPVNLAECTMKMLNDMLHLCRCSILFCTATQPNFQTRSDFKGIDHIVPLVENPMAIFAATKRVEYYPIADYEVQSIDSIAQKVCEVNESVLIVCNTKKKAKALFDSIQEKGNIQVLHLSTNMCQIHRMAVIDKVKSKLKNGEKLILCSTQLIEAGVDMDFPIVFRELAPLESIIQSAGRCNREGKLEKGKVFLFQLEEKGQPSAEYKTFTQFAQLCYHNNENRLTDADFYAEYYTDIVKLYAPEDTITPKREKLMFQDVADKYHIIDSSATSLFVYRYNEESLQLYKEITSKEYLSRKDYQQIAQYCVQVYNKFERDNFDKIAETSNGVKVWSGAYSEEFGLSNEEEIFCI